MSSLAAVGTELGMGKGKGNGMSRGNWEVGTGKWKVVACATRGWQLKGAYDIHVYECE